MTVSVVIPHYFAERHRHIDTIVDSLVESSLIPDELVVWNNGIEFDGYGYMSAPRVTFIRYPHNFGAQARFLAALTTQSDYVVFQDNDVVLAPKALENLLEKASPTRIVTLEGRIQRGGKPYSQWPKLYGHDLKESWTVTMSLGRGECVPRALLPRILAEFPFGPRAEMDDLWFSACAAKMGVPIIVVPCDGESGLADLPRFGTGACSTEGYYLKRDITIADIQRTLGVWGGEVAAAVEVESVGYV